MTKHIYYNYRHPDDKRIIKVKEDAVFEKESDLMEKIIESAMKYRRMTVKLYNGEQVEILPFSYDIKEE